MLKLKRHLILFFAGLALLTNVRAANWLNAGLLYDDFPLTLDAGHRTEALGPLFYWEQKDSQRTWAIPPLFSHVYDSVIDSTEWDLGYPVITYDRYGSEYRWHIFQVFSFAGGQNQEEQKARRFTLFPLYFQQRSDDPELNYTALLPFYGHIKNRLLRDEIFFVMFPVYGRSRKKDVVTDNYLYPVFHLRHGNGLNGWQVWPLVGHEHKEVTTKTNLFGDTDIVAGHDTWFAPWPIFFNSWSGTGTENPQHLQALIPFYILQRSPNRDSTTIGPPPFFSLLTLPKSKSSKNSSGSKFSIPLINPFNVTHTVDREKKYREWDAPWPLIVFANGEGKTTTRVWPFFSQAHNAILQSDFYAWPIYKYNRVHSDPLDRRRTRILEFLYSDIKQRNTETGLAQHRVDFWPLFTFKRDYNGSTRLQVFAPIEPILPNNKSIERDYSPVWSVWRSEKNTKTGASSQSLLWNLYRRECTSRVVTPPPASPPPAAPRPNGAGMMGSLLEQFTSASQPAPLTAERATVDNSTKGDFTVVPVSKKCSLLFGLFQYQSGSDGKRLRLFYIPVVKTKPAAK
ncbi:MAG: hypothetical protein QOD03_1622 [Verrucomicrobiota bacterium]|jgi:hypothetical protein